jgi:putative PIN family toxin of toxin-antitoxin system
MTVVDRVVLDTNVWISGLLWRGNPHRCLLLARGKVIEAFYCHQMAAELSQKLRDPFGFSENRIEAVMYDLRRTCMRVNITGALHVVTADPDDDKFVECAVVAGATIIVSGDGHLLELGKFQDITMLSAAQFLERFQAE